MSNDSGDIQQLTMEYRLAALSEFRKYVASEKKPNGKKKWTVAPILDEFSNIAKKRKSEFELHYDAKKLENVIRGRYDIIRDSYFHYVVSQFLRKHCPERIEKFALRDDLVMLGKQLNSFYYQAPHNDVVAAITEHYSETRVMEVIFKPTENYTSLRHPSGQIRLFLCYVASKQVEELFYTAAFVYPEPFHHAVGVWLPIYGLHFLRAYQDKLPFIFSLQKNESSQESIPETWSVNGFCWTVHQFLFNSEVEDVVETTSKEVVSVANNILGGLIASENV
ncbi:MAG: hypothetical protein ABW130_18435 [Candidatus Thiodiazotropha lotti]|nr:hypothetical protein [Candidatus Thiodiazotropha lotti]MCW4221654.1 hypothetical protein [Candidatus Thiodiazotropha lotti]